MNKNDDTSRIMTKILDLEEAVHKSHDEVLDKMQKNNNRVVTVLDDVMKQLEIIREDKDLAIKQAEDHEKRITKLEKAQKTN